MGFTTSPLNSKGIPLDMLEKCQLVPVRIPSLFQQNVFKAVGRTLIEGICKVYAGKTNWRISWKLYPWSLCKQEVRSNWSTLTDDSYSSSIYLFPKACGITALQKMHLALLVSIPNRWWSNMNPIRSTVSFEHEIPGADIPLLIT